MSGREKGARLGSLQPDIFLDEVPPELLKPIENLNGDAENLLTSVLGHQRIFERLEKHKRKIDKADDFSEISKSIIDEFRGMSTEYMSYLELRNILGNTMTILSPANVDQIYKAAARDTEGPDYFSCKPDGIILQPRGHETYIIGSCEYTCAENVEKRRQLNGYYSGEVVDFILSQRSDKFKKELSNKINTLYPHLPPSLRYDEESFETLLTHPSDSLVRNVPDHCTLLPLPLKHREITDTATHLIHSFAKNETAQFQTDHQHA